MIITTLIAMIMTKQALAVPTLYPEKFNTAVKNLTSSNLVSDTQTITRFYVLPPKQAEAKVTSLNTVSANIGFCKEISEIQKYNLDTLQMLNELKQREFDLRNQISLNDNNIKKAQTEMQQYINANHLGELAQYDLQIKNLSFRLDHLYDKSRICSANECQLIVEDISATQEKLNELWQLRIELSQKHINSQDEYEKRKIQISQMQKEQENSLETIQKIRADLKDIYSDFLSLYDAHAGREGSKVGLQYNSNWQQNIQQLKIDNPSFQFEKINTENVQVRSDAYNKNSLIPGGALIGFNVAGVNNSNGIIDFKSYPENFSGNAILNLLGACPLIYPHFFNLTADSDAVNPYKMKFPLSVAYDYPSEFSYSVKLSYNLYKLYELTLNRGTQNGFFNTRSWSDKEENEYYKDSFNVIWNFQSPKYSLTPDQKISIENDMKNQMLSRIAKKLVMQNSNSGLLSAPDAPKAGALVISDSLTRACGFNFYCKGASFGLNALFQIFSSSQMTTSYKQQLNVEARDSLVSQQVLMVPALTTFQ